jgi:predicted nucleic acid-binding protein
MLQDAIDMQATMLAVGMGRKPLPDLIIAAVARAHHAVVIHYDRDFEDMAKIDGTLRARWLSTPL